MKALLLVALAGCDFAFGLQHQDPVADAPPVPDAPPPASISGHVSGVYVSNSADGKPITTSITYTSTQLHVFYADPTSGLESQVPFDAASGTFTVPATGARTRIRLHFGDSVYEFAWSLPKLELVLANFLRPGSVTAAAGTTLSGTETPAPAAMVIYASGSWGGASATYPTIGSYKASWTGALVSGTANDRMIYAGYTADAAGDLVITKQKVVALDMVNGDNPRPIVFDTLTLDACASAVTHVAENRARLDAAYPQFANTTGGSLFAVYGSVLPALGANVLWQIGHTPYDAATAMMMYSSAALPGTTPLYGTLSARTRVLANGFTAQTQSLRLEEPQPCPTVVDVAAHTVALPNQFTLDGSPITPDDLTTFTPTGPTIELAWAPNGDADLYQIQIYDLTTSAYLGRVIYTAVPHVTLDRGDYLPGHSFSFLAIARKGLANLAGGDPYTVRYPFERGIGSSPVFKIP